MTTLEQRTGGANGNKLLQGDYMLHEATEHYLKGTL